MLSEKELAEIEARANAATKGLWINCDGKRKPGKSIFLHATACEEEDIYGGPSRYGPHRDYVCNCLESGPIKNADALLNATFIAHARADVPALIASHRAQREEITRLRDVIRTAATQPTPAGVLRVLGEEINTATRGEE